MAKNKLIDLNNHLFSQLERLNDEELTPEQIDLECKKARAMKAISSEVIKSYKLTLDAVKLASKGDVNPKHLPQGFEINQNILS